MTNLNSKNRKLLSKCIENLTYILKYVTIYNMCYASNKLF